MAKYQSEAIQIIYEFAIIDLFHFTITILQVIFNIHERTHCLCPIEQMFRGPTLYIPSIPGREGIAFFYIIFLLWVDEQRGKGSTKKNDPPPPPPPHLRTKSA